MIRLSSKPEDIVNEKNEVIERLQKDIEILEKQVKKVFLLKCCFFIVNRQDFEFSSSRKILKVIDKKILEVYFKKSFKIDFLKQ